MARVFLRNIRSNRRQAALMDLDSLTRKQLEMDLDSKVKPALVKSHELIVKDWTNKVTFGSRKVIKNDRILVYVFPTGANKQIWIYVDQGTKPHKIPSFGPVNARVLRFQAGGKYNPKTLPSPARTNSGGGQVTGGTTVYAKRVKDISHPGNTARLFSKTIAEDSQPGVVKVIEGSFRLIAKKVEE